MEHEILDVVKLAQLIASEHEKSDEASALSALNKFLKAPRVGSGANEARKEFLAEYPCRVLFDRLGRAKEVDDLCALLVMLLKDSEECIEFIKGHEKATEFLRSGLLHIRVPVRNLVFTEVERFGENVPLWNAYVVKWGLPEILLRMIADPLSSLAHRAAALLLKFTLQPEVLDAIVAEMRFDTDDQDVTVHFRMLDFFVSIALQGKESCRRMIEIGALQEVVRLCSTRDVLLKINAAELVSRLCTKPCTMQYLVRSSVPGQIAEDLLSESVLPTAKCALLETAGKVFASLQDDSLRMQLLFAVASHLRDIDTQTNAVAAVVDIVKSARGIRDVHEFSGGAIEKLLLDFVRSADDALRLGSLACVANMLTVTDGVVEEVQIAWLDELCIPSSHKALFRGGGTSPPPVHTYTPTLLQFVLAPFPGLRYATLHVFSSLCLHEWGVKRMLEWLGVYEWLLDRSTETSKIGMDWKYAILSNLIKTHEAASSKSRAVVPPLKAAEIRRYLSEGVAYKGSEVVLAVETQGV